MIYSFDINDPKQDKLDRDRYEAAKILDQLIPDYMTRLHVNNIVVKYNEQKVNRKKEE